MGNFTMFPLLKKDKLQIPYLLCNVIFLCLTYLFAEEAKAPSSSVFTCNRFVQVLHSQVLKKIVIGLSSAGIWLLSICLEIIIITVEGMLVLHVLELYVQPPAKYPDLYPALFSIYGCANLAFIYLVGIYWIYTCEDSKIAEKKTM